MRRNLNVKLVAVVLGSLLVLGVSVHFMHGYQVRRNAYRLLERADQAVAEHNEDRALAFYKQYLSFVPNDADTMQKYVAALDRRGDDGERVRLVLLTEQVLRAKPNEHALRLRLVHNLIALDRLPEAAGNLKRLRSANIDKAEVLHMLGWCQDAMKDYTQAVRSFEEAIRIKPTQIKTYSLLAEVLHDRLHQPADARKVVDDLVKENAGSYQAYLVRARFLRRGGDDALAQANLQRALELAPDRPDVILEAADAERARGNWPAAVKLLQDGMKRHPDNLAFYKKMADVKMLSARNDEAIDHLKDGLRHAPQSSELAILLIDLLIDQRADVEARARIDDLVKAGMKPALPNYLKARLAVADRKWPDAITLLESVQRDLGPGSDWTGRVHALLGLCYRNIGDRARELQAFRRAVQEEPTWILANVGLGAALLNDNQIQEASETLEPLRTAKDLPSGYWVLLSEVRFAKQVRLPDVDRRWDALEEALAQAAQVEPKSPAPATLRGDMFALQRNHAEAIKEYGRALDLGATQPRVLASLVSLLIQDRSWDKAEAAFAKYEQKQALTPALARLGAEVAMNNRDPKLAVKRAEQAVALPPRDYRDALWLAHIEKAAGETAKVEKLLHAALADAGHVPDVWVAWMEHLQQTKQHDRGVRDLERLKKELPANLQRLTLARCYEALQMPIEAGQAFEEALRESPNDPGVLLEAADFQRRAGHIEDARTLYERLLDPAVAADARTVNLARRHLAELSDSKKK